MRTATTKTRTWENTLEITTLTDDRVCTKAPWLIQHPGVSSRKGQSARPSQERGRGNRSIHCLGEHNKNCQSELLGCETKRHRWDETERR